MFSPRFLRLKGTFHTDILERVLLIEKGTFIWTKNFLWLKGTKFIYLWQISCFILKWAQFLNCSIYLIEKIIISTFFINFEDIFKRNVCKFWKRVLIIEKGTLYLFEFFGSLKGTYNREVLKILKRVLIIEHAL